MQKIKAGILVPYIFLVFKKAIYEVKANGLQLSFNIFRQPQLRIQSKQFVWNFRLLINLDFLEKGLGIVSALHFVHDFSRKMPYSINWPNCIVWFPLLLEILGNMCIQIVCFPDCDVKSFENNRFSTFFIYIFQLIKPFFYMTKMSRQKFKYLESKTSF